MKKSEKYFGFTDCDDVMSQFNVPAEQQIESKNILFAYYGSEDYEGAAWVIFVKNRKLYEVNGGHCSCYGLEDQWKPELTSWEALSGRSLPFGDCGNKNAAVEAFQKLVERKLQAKAEKKNSKEPNYGSCYHCEHACVPLDVDPCLKCVNGWGVHKSFMKWEPRK